MCSHNWQLLCFLIYQVSFLVFTVQIQQIDHAFCTFDLNRTDFKFKREISKVHFPDGHIKFSVCAPSLLDDKGNKVSALITINGKSISAGSHFDISNSGKDRSTIQSVGGAKCDSSPEKNYTITIALVCDNDAKDKEVIVESQCEYKIKLLRDTCRPYCTQRIDDGFLIDLRPLKRIQTVEYGNRTFSVGICTDNVRCGPKISSCETTNGNTISISGDQSINFKRDKNTVILKGKSGRKIFELAVLCNWETDFMNLQYLTRQIEGRKYKFSVESRYGCVKLQQDCVMSADFHHTIYNLNGLYKKDGWNVANVTKGKMYLNLCGDLEITPVENICNDYASQVCEVTTNGSTFISRGSRTSFRIEDNTFQAVIADGSVCKPQVNYETIIDFECNNKEFGLILSREDNCTSYLKWKTPHACPYYHTVNAKSCLVNDEYGSRGLSDLSKREDRVIGMPGGKLIYNICGPIKTACGPNIGNVSVCLIEKSKATVIGWLDTEIISENQTIALHLKGELCSKSTEAEAIVNFVCDRTKKLNDRIDVIRDNCAYNITVFTDLACTKHVLYKSECQVCSEKDCYDLTPLIRTDSNYHLKNPLLPDCDIILNMCSTVLNEPDLVCVNSLACIRNNSESNVKYRYISLGSIDKLKVSEDGNSLIMKSHSGMACGNEYYQSIFHFICSDKDFYEVIRNEKCIFEFHWHTKYACGHNKKSCTFKHHSGKEIDLNNVNATKNIHFEITEDNYYDFNLCDDKYIRYLHGKQEYGIVNRSLEDNTLVLSTGKSCSKDDQINTVLVHLFCEDLVGNNDHYDSVDSQNCIRNMNLKTKQFCPLQIEIPKVTQLTPPDNSKNKQREITPAIAVDKVYLYCNISSVIPGNKIDTLKLTSSHISLNNQQYIIEWTSDKIRSNNCDRISANKSSNTVNMSFVTNIKCNSRYRDIKVTLQCGNVSNLSHEEDCTIYWTYRIPEMCEVEDIKAASYTAEALGITGSILLIMLIAIAFFFLKRRFKSSNPEDFSLLATVSPSYKSD